MLRWKGNFAEIRKTNENDLIRKSRGLLLIQTPQDSPFVERHMSKTKNLHIMYLDRCTYISSDTNYSVGLNLKILNLELQKTKP